MKILYGISPTNSIDVTNICLSKLTKNNVIIIPDGDQSRANIFTDPLYGFLKKIIILNQDNNDDVTESEYGASLQVYINIQDNTIQTINITQQIENIHMTLQLIINNKRDKLEMMKKTHIQKCIEWCQKYNIPYHKNILNNNIFLSSLTTKLLV